MYILRNMCNWWTATKTSVLNLRKNKWWLFVFCKTTFFIQWIGFNFNAFSCIIFMWNHKFIKIECCSYDKLQCVNAHCMLFNMFWGKFWWLSAQRCATLFFVISNQNAYCIVNLVCICTNFIIDIFISFEFRLLIDISYIESLYIA